MVEAGDKVRSCVDERAVEVEDDGGGFQVPGSFAETWSRDLLSAVGEMLQKGNLYAGIGKGLSFD
ncbi:hypothetical protein RNA01_00550 [Ciceribacter naphthalenivorans]|uniref:Uncharacterized protein n=1 Tax=Ciceribacter naphthalenivorans TaxID=1118451 RepID=A0A512HCE7_9HYPH|nr:hypothetical protein RNA01_00550 [Ciceribacter naphthalenivorans]